MTDSFTPATISANELLPLLDDHHHVLVDVREIDEFADWHIPGAINIPLGELSGRTHEIPLNRDIVTVCAKGARAAQAAEMLNGLSRPAVVLEDGMAGWGHSYEDVEISLGAATITQVRRRGKGCLSYVIGAGSRAVVIDPTTEVQRYLDIAARHSMTITHVFDTHLHADHLSGARELVALTGATLALNPADPFAYDFTAITDGMRVELEGDLHLTVGAVSTPGHTEGSTVYRLGDVALFTGDTLFLESVGRPDLADQAEVFAHLLYRSLHEIVLPLNDSILVFPAHYGDSVDVRFGVPVMAPLGQLRESLPALAYDEDQFVSWAVAHVKDRPPNYTEIVKFNAGVSTLGLGELIELELGPNRCAIAG